jgi:hypothetical protein
MKLFVLCYWCENLYFNAQKEDWVELKDATVFTEEEMNKCPEKGDRMQVWDELPACLTRNY